MNRILLCFAVLAAGCLMGCADKVATYEISVTNRLNDPVTVWLTKSVGPFEDGWAPPEELALENTGDRYVGGVVVNPGQTGHAKVQTKVQPNNPAELRIYRATDINTILSINRGSPERLDMTLIPGATDIDVIQNNRNAIDVEQHMPGATVLPSPSTQPSPATQP